MSASHERWIAVACCAAALASTAACSNGSRDPAVPLRADAASQRLGEILADRDPLRRAERLGALLPRVGPEALPAVLEAFERSSLDGLDPEFVLLATWWARFDPEAALAWGTRSDRATSYSVIAAVLRAWAHSDPKAAWARAGKMPQDSAEFARAAVIAGWEESDASGLLEHVRAFSDPTTRQGMLEVVARRRVLTLGGEGAIRWIESLPLDAFRSELEPRVASALVMVDPAAAAAWVAPRITAARDVTGFARRVGTRWVRRDPEPAMAWLASLPPGVDRDDGVMESFRDWQGSDPTAATAWISAQEREPWLEPALALHADQLAMERPEAALALVAHFSDPTLRDRFTTTIARKWLSRDYAAAQVWLQNAEIPEDVRGRIRVLPTEETGASRTRVRGKKIPSS